MGLSTSNIRNIAVLGHSGEGKTSLCEAILFNAKVIDRMGKVSDGNTVMDFDEQEVAKKISISLSCAYANYNDVKINLIDVPGFFDFESEAEEAIRGADAAIVVADANGQVGVGTELMINKCMEKKLPIILFINGIDKENANYQATVDAFKEMFGDKIAAVNLPIFDGNKLKGVCSIIDRKAHMYAPGSMTMVDVPDDLHDEYASLRDAIAEKAAETDDALIEKFFSDEGLAVDEITQGIKTAIRSGSAFPVYLGSATENIGVTDLMNAIISLLPSPADETIKDVDGKDIVCDVNGTVVAQVIKTIVDPFVGKLNIIRVYRGKLASGMTLYNMTTNEKERINQLFILRGKKQETVSELIAGDIGGVNKLNNTNTGDTLSDETAKVKLPDIPFEKPVLTFAITAMKSGDEDKIFQGLNKLSDEDRSFIVEKDVDTGEMVIRGQGETQLDLLCKKLKSKFNVSAVLKDPTIAYKETIKGRAEAEGKHKKQSGGAGQFGVANIRFEPGASDGTFEFVDAVVGGAVPKQFIPCVEKGLREAILKGVLAGYPVVNLKATLFDGKSHPVDSKEVAFVSAAKLAFEEGIRNAKPVLLEPIYSYKITVPESYMGDILGDMNKRRGRILGMDLVDGKQVISAEAPLAEMFRYAIDLRSMTQGRGRFSGEFVRYEEVPAMAQEKIIADAKAREAE